MKYVLHSVGIFAGITLLNGIAVAQSRRDTLAGEWKLDWLKSADSCKDEKWEKRFREATSSGYEAIYSVQSGGVLEAQSITPERTKKKRHKWLRAVGQFEIRYAARSFPHDC